MNYKKQNIKPTAQYINVSLLYKEIISNQKPDKKIIVTVGKTKAKNVTVACKLSIDRKGTPGSTETVSRFERAVIDALCTAWYYFEYNNKQPVITTTQLLQLVTNDYKKIRKSDNPQILLDIDTAVTRLNSLYIILDAEEQEKNWNQKKINASDIDFKKKQIQKLIDITKCTVINIQGIAEPGYIINSKPLLMEYAERYNFITSFPLVPDVEPLRHTQNNIILKNYIINEVANRQHQQKSQKKNTAIRTWKIDIKEAYKLYYKTSYKIKCKSRNEYVLQANQRKRLTKQITKILEAMQSINILTLTDEPLHFTINK